MKSYSSIALFALSIMFGSAFAQGDLMHRYVDSQGREVIVTSGQPAPRHYGPRPTFQQLDPDHDGSISRKEAEAFPPLANDFDFLTHGGTAISPQQYARWDYR